VVTGNYKGLLLNTLGIGDRLDKLINEYDFLFYADLHYLAKKKNFDSYTCSTDISMNQSWENREIESVEIRTNYLLPYSLEAKDHIVDRIGVYDTKE
jgi:hypothetical protein